MKTLGVSGLRHQGGYIYEEFLPELAWPGASRVYQEMSSNDAVIGSILYLAEMLIRGCNWNVKEASNSTEDIAAKDFLKSCMDDMDTSWANTICEILSMLVYGFSFHEIVYKIRRGPTQANGKYRSLYTDGKIGWRRLPIRSQESFYQWEFDDSGDVVAFVQQAMPNYNLTRIPMDRGLLFRTKVSRDNPEGRSLLRNAYRSWFFKKHFEEIEGIGIERDLAGFPVLTAPQDMDLWNDQDPVMVKLLASAEDLVSSIRRDSEEGAVLPSGWELKLLASSSSRQINIGETIDRYDNRIAITMLSDIILIGNKQSGSFALADTKQSMLAAALQAQVMNIADVFNSKAVPDLFIKNNMNVKEYPKIVPSQIQSPSLKEVALMLRAMGLKIGGDMELQNYIRQILSMPSIDEETFKKVYEVQGIKPAAEVDPLTGLPKVPVGQKPATGKVKAVNGVPVNGAGIDRKDDSVDNTFEQSDMSYTGGEK